MDDRLELKRAVLTAPIWMQATKSSSRQVADAVGLSQSFVARTWKELAAPAQEVASLREILADRQMVLVGFAIGPEGSCLVLVPSRASRLRYPASLTTNSKRRLRTVLAADLLRSVVREPNRTDDRLDLWSSLESSGRSITQEATVVVSGGFAVPAGLRTAAHFADSWAWQKLVGALDLLPEVPNGETLIDLEWRIRRWYHSGRSPFSWTVDRDVPTTMGSIAQEAQGTENIVAEDILSAIRQGLVDGLFSGESEISLSTLNRLLGAPVRDIRTAVRALTEDGLVTAARSDSVVVRIPSLDDVSETYMARRALGAIVVRAASRWSPGARSRVKHHLDELGDCARRNDVTRAHYVDMDFQIALFEASGLNRIPAILETLTKQAFMHFAVMGARYAFSPQIILDQNTEIFEAIDAGDLRAATLSWQSKMDVGLNYLAQHISAMNAFNEGRGSTRG
ncbi:GntR family transcriptional regulator [Paenarthrobacter histidinolovorans]|uniref:DNA-binding GntR family transcriptional regulator n=1 Tax=Paenarthrobacter histidinolovorans TaxID=43664 RepID=A0ABW8N735_9MICC